MDLCDLTYKFRSHFFAKDRDITLQTSRILTLGDGTDVTASCFVPVGGIILWSGAIAAIPTNWALCNGSNGTPDLRDRFVVGAGSTYAVGATGGSATKDLSHTHADGTLATDTEAAHTHGAGSYATDTEAAHTHDDGSYATDTEADHVHSIAANLNTHTVASGTGAVVADDTHVHGPGSGETGSGGSHAHDVTGTSGSGGSHAHDVTGTSGSGGSHSHDVTGSTASGGSATQDVLNPYYALAYIMRTA